MALAFRNYMVNTLTIPVNQARALMDEGIDDFEDLLLYRDDDIVHLVNNCRKTHRPAPPAPGAGPAALAAWNDIRPGIHIPEKSCTRFRQLALYCNHLDMTDRVFQPNDATLDRLKDLWDWHKNELDQEEKQDLKEPEPLKHENKARKTLEELDHYLLMKRGVGGVPLAYLVREDVEPGPDPGYGQPTITDDLIARVPHGPDSVMYDTDNKYLWKIIMTMTQGGFAWTWVSDQNKSRNGRQAYIQLKTHFLGKAFKTKIKAAADKIISTTTYTGYKGFTLDNYGAKMRDAFTDLTTNGEPMTENRKVTKYLENITDPKLQVVKGIILATEELSNNFDRAVSFASEYLVTSEAAAVASKGRNISSMGGRGRGGRGGRGGRFGRGGRGGRGGGRGRGKGKTDYLPAKKWHSLSQEEKQAIIDARDKAGIKRKVEEVTTDDESKKKKPATGLGDSMTRRND
jgi:hypothetical protein